MGRDAEEKKKNKGESCNAPLFKGSRTPGIRRYRCFLSDLTGFSNHPPSGFPEKLCGGEERI